MESFLQHDALDLARRLSSIAGRHEAELLFAASAGVLAQILCLVALRLVGTVLGIAARVFAFALGVLVALAVLFESGAQGPITEEQACRWIAWLVESLEQVVDGVPAGVGSATPEGTAPVLIPLPAVAAVRSAPYPASPLRGGGYAVEHPAALVASAFCGLAGALLAWRIGGRGGDQALIGGALAAFQVLVAGALYLTMRLPWNGRRSDPDLRCRPQMSVREFRAKWSAPELRHRTEEALRHEFLLDLLRTVGIKTPAAVDPAGSRVAFELAVAMPGGGLGFIDLAIDRCAIEVKRPGADLRVALDQLREYGEALPRLLVFVVTNIVEIEVLTRFGPGAAERSERFALDALDRRALRILRLAFTDPERLRPRRFAFRRLLAGRAAEGRPTSAASGRSPAGRANRRSDPGRHFHMAVRRKENGSELS